MGSEFREQPQDDSVGTALNVLAKKTAFSWGASAEGRPFFLAHVMLWYRRGAEDAKYTMS